MKKFSFKTVISLFLILAMTVSVVIPTAVLGATITQANRKIGAYQSFDNLTDSEVSVNANLSATSGNSWYFQLDRTSTTAAIVNADSEASGNKALQITSSGKLDGLLQIEANMVGKNVHSYRINIGDIASGHQIYHQMGHGDWQTGLRVDVEKEDSRMGASRQLNTISSSTGGSSTYTFGQNKWYTVYMAFDTWGKSKLTFKQATDSDTYAGTFPVHYYIVDESTGEVTYQEGRIRVPDDKTMDFTANPFFKLALGGTATGGTTSLMLDDFNYYLPDSGFVLNSTDVGSDGVSLEFNVDPRPDMLNKIELWKGSQKLSADEYTVTLLPNRKVSVKLTDAHNGGVFDMTASNYTIRMSGLTDLFGQTLDGAYNTIYVVGESDAPKVGGGYVSFDDIDANKVIHNWDYLTYNGGQTPWRVYLSEENTSVTVADQGGNHVLQMDGNQESMEALFAIETKLNGKNVHSYRINFDNWNHQYQQMFRDQANKSADVFLHQLDAGLTMNTVDADDASHTFRFESGHWYAIYEVFDSGSKVSWSFSYGDWSLPMSVYIVDETSGEVTEVPSRLRIPNEQTFYLDGSNGATPLFRHQFFGSGSADSRVYLDDFNYYRPTEEKLRVVSSMPARNETGVAPDAEILIEFNIDPKPTALDQILLYEGDTPLTADQYTVKLLPDRYVSIKPSAAYNNGNGFKTGTSYSVKMDGLTDVFGQSVTEVSKSIPFTVMSETDVPGIVRSAPESGAESALELETVTAVFSAVLDENTVIPENITVTGSDGSTIPVKAATLTDGKTVTLTLGGNLLTGTAYTVTFTQNVKSKFGVSVNENSSFSFTAATVQSPTDTQTVFAVPANGSTVNVAPKTIELSFNQPLYSASAKPENFALDNDAKISGVTVSSDCKTVKLTFAQELAVGEYTLTMNGVKDIYGNTVSPEYGFTFAPFFAGELEHISGNQYTAKVTVNAKEEQDVTLFAAVYGDGNVLLDISVEPYTLTPGQNWITLQKALTVPDIEKNEVRYFVFHGKGDSLNLKPYTMPTIGTVDANYWPDWTRKAVTLSYDDGVITSDKPMLERLQKENLTATFNMIACNFEGTWLTEESKQEYIELYKRNEVCNHAYAHKAWTNELSDLSIFIEDAQKGDDKLEEIFGEGSVNGFAYPNGYPNGRPYAGALDDYLFKRGDYADTGLGYVYTRSANESHTYDVPSVKDDEWKQWTFTTHHNNLFSGYNHWEDFSNLPDDGELKLLSVWGHTHEFTEETWETIFNHFIDELVENRDELYIGTSIDMYRYKEALEKLEITSTEIINRGSVDVYVKVDGENVIVPAMGVWRP